MSRSDMVPISADDLLVVVSEMWDAAFGRAVVPIDVEPEPGDSLWATVDIVDGRGPVGELTVVCNGPVFRAVARSIFGVAQPDPIQSVAVVAEAANIVAGNVKGILSLHAYLSVPRAGRGAPPTPRRYHDGTTAREIAVRAGDGGRMRVSVHLLDHCAARIVRSPIEEETRPSWGGPETGVRA